ncbi:hypothetical protein [Kribbella italica]|nr:hypothetical protein [Kribbella italica]
MTTVNAHVDRGTGMEHTLYGAEAGSGRAWVVVTAGDYRGGTFLFFHDLDVLTAYGELIERARRDLAGALGLLPSGEPCLYVDLFGSLEWSDHDHAVCLDKLVEEPVRPAMVEVPAGTAWERHDDPTVEDNPLDADDDYWTDEDYSDSDDDADDSWSSNRLLRAEGLA